MSIGNYNKDSVVTAGQLEDALTLQLQAVKDWCLNNVDSFAVMQHIADELDIANRAKIEGNAAVKLQVLNNSITQIFQVLENAGADVLTAATKDLAEIIANLTSTYEVCIIDKEGNKWTVGQWQIYQDEHGTTPSEGAVVAVITPYKSFVIGTTVASRTWGTYGKDVVAEAGLYAAQTGAFVNVLKNNLHFKSYENTKRLLLAYHPIDDDLTPVVSTIQFDPALPLSTYNDYLCVLFASYQEMIDSGLHVTFDQQTYVVLADENTPDANGNPTPRVNYFWDGGAYKKRFQVPYVDSQKIVGCPAAKYAWLYKAWTDDKRQWTLPTINHLLICYAYYTQINECLYAINRSPLPTSNTWACEQNNTTYAYCVVPSSGQVGNVNKGSSCAVLTVAALDEDSE